MPGHRTTVSAAILATVVAGLALFAASCGNTVDGAPATVEPGTKLRVVATTAPVAALAAEVGGDLIDLHVLVPPGTDPHDFELRVNGRKAIDRANVILMNGVGLDDFLHGAIGENRDRVTTVSEGVSLRDAAGDEHAAEDGHDHEGGDFDPHIWQSPANAKVMVDNIVGAFARADETNAVEYRARGDAYNKRLDETDRVVRDLIATIPPENRKMVTNHDAFGYFIQRYGLTYVGAVIPSLTTQAEPTAKQVAALADTIRREGVKAIFAEHSIDPRVARQLAKDTGVQIVDDLYGDSLGPPGTETATIDGMLLWNARRIAEALR